MHLPVEDIRRVLSGIKADDEYADALPYVILTGGEPMMHPDFLDIIDMIHGMGFRWGMTTNGTLIGASTAARFAEKGLYSIAVSIDGTEQLHDDLRRVRGAYRRAMDGLKALIHEDAFHVSVTTVVTHESMGYLNDIYGAIFPLDIDSWRLMAVEPIGRAKEDPGLLLTKEDYRNMFGFIHCRRAENVPVEYGCMHYLGLDYEREVRDWYFSCLAGVSIASVMSDGRIGACLDIERNDATVQGSIYEDDLLNVWRNRFGAFRRDLAADTAGCAGCGHAAFCRGGSHHTYDHVSHAQGLCMKGVLFD